MAMPKDIRDYAIEEIKLTLQDFINRVYYNEKSLSYNFTDDLHCVSADVVDEVLRIAKETG